MKRYNYISYDFCCLGACLPTPFTSISLWQAAPWKLVRGFELFYKMQLAEEKCFPSRKLEHSVFPAALRHHMFAAWLLMLLLISSGDCTDITLWSDACMRMSKLLVYSSISLCLMPGSALSKQLTQGALRNVEIKISLIWHCKTVLVWS